MTNKEIEHILKWLQSFRCGGNDAIETIKTEIYLNVEWMQLMSEWIESHQVVEWCGECVCACVRDICFVNVEHPPHSIYRDGHWQ